MKVLTVILMGGSEAVAIHRVHANLVRSISDSSDNTVCFISGNDGSTADFPQGTEFLFLHENKRVVTKPGRLSHWFSRHLLKAKLETLIKNVDLVIVDGIRVAAFIAKSCQRQRVKCLSIVHGMVASTERRAGKNEPLLSSDLFWYCGVSHAVARGISHIFPDQQKHIHAVVNGLEVEAVRQQMHSRQEARTLLGLGSDEFVLGLAARLERHKNVESLIQMFARYRTQEDARLVIIGDGRVMTDLKELASSLGIAGSIIFTGYKTKAYRYLRAFDVYAQTSRQEGMALSVLEAQIAGLPTLLSDIESFREVASASNNPYCRVFKTEAEFVKTIADFRGPPAPKPDYDTSWFDAEKTRDHYRELIGTVCKSRSEFAEG